MHFSLHVFFYSFFFFLFSMIMDVFILSGGEEGNPDLDLVFSVCLNGQNEDGLARRLISAH